MHLPLTGAFTLSPVSLHHRPAYIMAGKCNNSVKGFKGGQAILELLSPHPE